MTTPEPHCCYCGCQMAYTGLCCVSCYRRHAKPCPKCVGYSAKGETIRRGPRGGRPMDCGYCGNKRVVMDPPPGRPPPARAA